MQSKASNLVQTPAKHPIEQMSEIGHTGLNDRSPSSIRGDQVRMEKASRMSSIGD